MFIRKRDPRYKSHTVNQNTTKAKNNGKSSVPITDTYLGSAFVEQEWQRTAQATLDHADLEWAAAETGEDAEEWECIACGKTFRSEASWNSHERSKKHMQAVEQLKREMLDDETTLGLDNIEKPQGEYLPSDSSDPPADPEGDVADKQNVSQDYEDDNSTTRQSRKKRLKAKPRPPSPEIVTKTGRRMKGHIPKNPEDEMLPTRTPPPEDGPVLEDISELPTGATRSASTSVRDSTAEPTKRDKRRAREARKAKEEAASEVKLVCEQL